MQIDVVIPVRNGEHFIERCLVSVRAQTFKINKIIVVNDGSTDNTANIVKFQPGYGEDLVLLNNPPTGLSNARNTGINFSNAKYIALLDCDDLWTESKLLNQVMHLESHGTCRMIFSNYQTFVEGTRNTRSGSKNVGSICSFQNVVMQDFRVLGSASSALIERKLLLEIGFFDENLKYGEDYDLWVRMSQVTNLCEVSTEDVLISIRPNSMQNQQEVGLDRFKNSLMYLKVWSKNNFKIVDRQRSKRLLWPDLRKSVLENPVDVFFFEKHVIKEFHSLYRFIYRNRIGFVLSIVKSFLDDVFSHLRTFIRKG